MKLRLWIPGTLVVAAAALGATAGCEKRPQEATSETRTTSAQQDRDTIGDDLRQAGKEIGAAAQKTAEEVKKGAEKLDDVKIGDKPSCDMNAETPRACDGGGVTITNKTR